MLFKDYKHIELLDEDITVSAKRIEGKKIAKVKNWKPSNPFRLRVKATVRKGEKRHIRKRTFVYEGIYMVEALEKAQGELKALVADIKAGINRPAAEAPTDKDRMFTFGEAFMRSIDSRKAEAEAMNEEFRTYGLVKAFYENHLKQHLDDIYLDQVDRDMLNRIRANMKHEDGTPFSKRTKMAVFQQVNPVYTWFNEYSNLSVKTPAGIKRGELRTLNNKRVVRVNDIAPIFRAMANYTYKNMYGMEKKEPFRSIFMWIMHGRRVNEVLSLRWEDINLDQGTYKIRASSNKAKKDMTYKLTPYLKATLTEPKKRGYLFTSQKDKTKKMQQVTLATHWKKVRKNVGEWTLNGEKATPDQLHLHDMRHLIATEMLNKYHIVDEISGAVLGHVRSGVTSTYAEMLTDSIDEAIMKVLDGVLK